MALSIARETIAGRRRKIHADPETYANGATIVVSLERLEGDDALKIKVQTLIGEDVAPRLRKKWRTASKDTLFTDGDTKSFRAKFVLSDVPTVVSDGQVVRAVVVKPNDSGEVTAYSLSINGR